MVRRTIGGVTYTLTYDDENRLTGVTGGSVTASFVYDGDGNRVKSIIGTTTTYYVGNYFETGDTAAIRSPLQGLGGAAGHRWNGHDF